MIRDIVRHPAKILAMKCEPIAVTHHTRALIADMIETMLAADGLGLAAPQVGRALRVIVARDPDEPDVVHALVNPRILKGSGIKVWSNETCLSDPRPERQRRAVRMKRDSSVEVAGIDADGMVTTLRARGTFSAILQHEIDHLDGITIFDRMRAEVQ